MHDWGNNDDGWMNSRQRVEKLSRMQRLCQWILNKAICMFVITAVLSFVIASPLPLCIYFGIEGTALLYLLIF